MSDEEIEVPHDDGELDELTGVMLTGPLADRLASKLEDLADAYGPAQSFIRVWRFEDAPESLRAYSTNGGDEDWLAVVPPDVEGRHYIPWLQPGSSFGVCDVHRFELPDGTAIYIGSHA